MLRGRLIIAILDQLSLFRDTLRRYKDFYRVTDGSSLRDSGKIVRRPISHIVIVSTGIPSLINGVGDGAQALGSGIVS